MKHCGFLMHFSLLIWAACMLISGCCASVRDAAREDFPSTMPEDRYVRVGDVRYHYTEFAGPGENVLLQHGFASSTYTWEDVARILQKKGFHVWALDMMGFGFSDKPTDGAYDPVSLMEGVNAWMDSVGLKDVTFAGNSLGGGVAMLMAERHPGKVRRLVLIDPAVPYSFDMPFVVRLANLPGAPYLSGLLVGRWMVESNLQEVFYNKALATPRRVDAYLKRLQTPNAPYAQAMVARNAHMDVFAGAVAHLAKTKPDTLIIWGADDPWIPLSCACRLKKDLPFARLVVVPQCGHVPQEEKPGETAALIADFVSGKPIAETLDPCAAR